MIIIGEKINGSIPGVARAIEEKDAAYIEDLALKQVRAGAGYIDVCASVADEKEDEVLKWLIACVQKATRLPIAVDSPNVGAIINVLCFCEQPGLVNSVSMEREKADAVFPVIADTDWQCIALLCDDKGIPKTLEKRIAIFEDLMAKAAAYGIAPERLHIDPMVEMLCTSEDGVNMITEVMRCIKKQYPSIHITGAVSNISYNLPSRSMVNRAFMVLCMNAGMDSAILDPLDQEMLGMIYATEALKGEDEYCMEYISAYRDGLFGVKK